MEKFVNIIMSDIQVDRLVVFSRSFPNRVIPLRTELSGLNSIIYNIQMLWLSNYYSNIILAQLRINVAIYWQNSQSMSIAESN